MNSCKKLLSDDGSLVIITPSWIHHSWGPFYLDHTHCSPYTLQSLRDLAYLSGFKDVKVEYIYQLPIIWRFSFLKIVSKLAALFKIPYMPMYEGLTWIKWPKSLNKFLNMMDSLTNLILLIPNSSPSFFKILYINGE